MSVNAWAVAWLAFAAGYGFCRLSVDLFEEARRLWYMRRFRAAIRAAIAEAAAEKASGTAPKSEMLS
jgi:hypothetical protein